MTQTAKAEQKGRTHEGILSSAARLIREKGIAGAGVAQVMKGAGLTVGGFYAHFDSKEQLIDEALRRTQKEMRELLFHHLGDKPENKRAEIVLKRYLSALHRDEYVHGCTLPAVAGEIGTTAPEHRDVLEEQISELASALETHLLVKREPSRRHIALGLVALMYGGLTLARALRGSELSDEVLRACRAVGALVLRGARELPPEGRSTRTK